MARGTEESDNVVQLVPSHLAAAGGGPHDPGMGARVAKLEAAVERLQADMTDVKAVLGRLEPKISEMFGAFPHLATKAEVVKRPTVAGIIAIVAVIAAIASIPIWPAWIAAVQALSSAGH
jgi:hypothetical protein